MNELVTQVKWFKCSGDVWCGLHTVNLDHEHFNGMSGVYIIWHGGAKAKTVYVGKGIIRDRLKEHRGNPAFAKYIENGLYVTWARIPASMVDGVESYLISSLGPLINDQQPSTAPLLVNTPW